MLMVKVKREDLQNALENLMSFNDADEVFIGCETKTNELKSRPLKSERQEEPCKKTIVITMHGNEVVY